VKSSPQYPQSYLPMLNLTPLAGFPPSEQSVPWAYRGALRSRDNGDALTRIKLAAQALEPNDLREGVPASISPLVPCHFSADDRRCPPPAPSFPSF
jgi:hypothetical protein